MPIALTKQDYKKILEYYNVEIPRNLAEMKEKASKIMATKLCKCIKKVEKTSSPTGTNAIAICNKSIFTRRNLRHSTFQCRRDGPKFLDLKKKKRFNLKLAKTRRKISFL